MIGKKTLFLPLSLSLTFAISRFHPKHPHRLDVLSPSLWASAPLIHPLSEFGLCREKSTRGTSGQSELLVQIQPSHMRDMFRQAEAGVPFGFEWLSCPITDGSDICTLLSCSKKEKKNHKSSNLRNSPEKGRTKDRVLGFSSFSLLAMYTS
jgi:hypothetical protein